MRRFHLQKALQRLTLSAFADFFGAPMNRMTEVASMNSKTGTQFAKLGSTHGYRFEGDTVHLHALLTLVNSEAHRRNWTLQLWACPEVPTADEILNGHLVAEATLPPIGEVVDDQECFETTAPASIPAGQKEFIMVLALKAKRAGTLDEIHDWVVYSKPQSFLQPRLGGNVGYRFQDNRVTLEAEQIENPRPQHTLSGTLALELWALPNPYEGGSFRGIPLAGVAFDPIPGASATHSRSFDLPCASLPEGQWHLTLMLREWTLGGFQTRDYSVFPVALKIEPKVDSTPAPMTANKVSATPNASSNRVVEPTRQPAATPAPTPAPAPAPTPVAKASPAKPAATVTALPTPTPSTPASSEPISVNRASREELEKIKGLPSKVVDGIVSKRPFRSLEELLKVKGMGQSLLTKLRNRLKL